MAGREVSAARGAGRPVTWPEPLGRPVAVERPGPQRRSWKVRPGRLFVACFSLYAALTLGSQQVTLWRLGGELKAVKQEIRRTTESNQMLTGEITRLQSKEYIEKAARERLGLTRPGEILYVPATNFAGP
jgi:cell division protein FtsB